MNEFLRVKDLNDQLLDANYNLLMRLISYNRKQGISVEPEILALVAQVRRILHRIGEPTKYQHPDKTPSDSTESA